MALGDVMPAGAVLITGGAGYIGSHAALACLDAGLAVVVLDDLSTGVRRNVSPQAAFVQGSLADRSILLNVMRAFCVDAIMHFAGSIVTSDSMADPAAYYRNNTVNSLNLIEAAVQAKIRRFIFSSTAAVYAPVSEGPLSETSQTRPISPYGRSKLMTEIMLAHAAKAHGIAPALPISSQRLAGQRWGWIRHCWSMVPTMTRQTEHACATTSTSTT